MQTKQNRRRFIQTTALLATGALLPSCRSSKQAAKPTGNLYEISLAEWSLNKPLFAGELDNLDFAQTAKLDYGINAVEYVNQFFKDKAKDQAYLVEMKMRAIDLGVKSLLIMIDGEGALGDPDPVKRRQAVENHFKWVEAAQFLGCHSIRVNAQTGGQGGFEEQQNQAAEGLHQLSEFAAPHGLNVIVENHGGLSSNGAWLVGVMDQVNLPNCGTLPDFGNFRLGGGEEYDRYLGVEEMMRYAKAVSAKSHDFDAAGDETHTDYYRMMRIVLDAGYRGYVGVEYEGSQASPSEGILLTKNLLLKVREELTPDYLV